MRINGLAVIHGSRPCLVHETCQYQAFPLPRIDPDNNPDPVPQTMPSPSKKTPTSPYIDTVQQWAEEVVPFSSVIRHAPLQVRHALDGAAVRQYQDMARAGQKFPPIKVARLPDGRLLLVDGWHRIEAGALEMSAPEWNAPDDGPGVLALVATMSEQDATWEAARANTEHGVRLKPGELRGVFRAFIKAGKHRLRAGKWLSYRELAAAIPIGKSYGTIRTWIKDDFPKLHDQMSSQEPAEAPKEWEQEAAPSIAEQQCAEVIRVAGNMRASLGKLTGQQRRDMVAALRALADEAERLGVEPDPVAPF